MKKRLFGFMLTAAVCTSMVMGAAGSEVTASDVLENYAKAQVNEVSADVTASADISVDAPDAGLALDVQGSADMDVEAALDPFAVSVTATMSGQAKSEALELDEDGSLDMTMYMVPDEDGVLSTYVGAGVGDELEWIKQSLGEETSAQILGMISDPALQEANLPIDFTLEDDHTDVNGTDCYVLKAVLTWEDLITIYQAALEKTAEVTGEELPEDLLPDEDTLGMVGMLMTGLQFNIEMDVDTTNYYPMRLYIDMEGSDWVTLGATAAAFLGLMDEDNNLQSVSIDVRSLYLEYIYDYSKPVTVTVPDEVIAQANDLGEVEDYAYMVEALESESELF